MNLIIWILFIHWIADFVFQSDRIAINKSKDWEALSYHSLIYFFTLTLGIGIYCLFVPAYVWKLSLLIALNLPAHFIIDAITSRINAKLWPQGNRHWFFVMIGLDQFLHYTGHSSVGQMSKTFGNKSIID